MAPIRSDYDGCTDRQEFVTAGELARVYEGAEAEILTTS